jgi:hypothetical protein
MPYRQLVEPNLSASRPAGWCLAFAQDVYGAPVRYRSAWDAWEAIPDKKFGGLPDVSVCVWMSHWGTYQGEYANWGHVVAYVPSKGFLSSPARGVGQQWFDTIEQVERTFNAKYVGWSESLNGLQIVEWFENPTPDKRKVDEMIVISYAGYTYLVGREYVVVAPNETYAKTLVNAYGVAWSYSTMEGFARCLRMNSVPKGVTPKLREMIKDDTVPAWSKDRGFYDANVSV